MVQARDVRRWRFIVIVALGAVLVAGCTFADVPGVGPLDRSWVRGIVGRLSAVASATPTPSPTATPTPSPTATPSPLPTPSPSHPPTRSPLPSLPRAKLPVIYGLPRAGRVVAITIDDGFDPAVCTAMADTLLRAHVPATFFPIGRVAALFPAVWRSIARHFPLGNHTAAHAILTHLGDVAIRRQIVRDEQLVKHATGRSVIHVLRPPGGVFDERVHAIAEQLGYRVLIWNTTNGDDHLDTAPATMVADATRGGPGAVILMHCNHPFSLHVLPRIIAAYRARGYRFVTIPGLLRRGG
jgi:peptidoglycan/xylan/chitin deacetylase (PgdA/CDA1 family)